MTAMTDEALVAVGLRKRYGEVRALDGVDLAVGRGEVLGLLGPNGAGKTTFVRVVAGLARADAGAAWVAGHDVVREWRRARASLGVVPQELPFDPFLKVREVLRLQAGYFGLGRAARPWIDELLERLGLAPLAASDMRALSGGMKRRVLIAQALVHRPQVLILDEPTAGADAAMRRILLDLLREQRDGGRGIVLITHQLADAEAICDRIAHIDHGRLTALGPARALLAAAREGA